MDIVSPLFYLKLQQLQAAWHDNVIMSIDDVWHVFSAERRKIQSILRRNKRRRFNILRGDDENNKTSDYGAQQKAWNWFCWDIEIKRMPRSSWWMLSVIRGRQMINKKRAGSYKSIIEFVEKAAERQEKTGDDDL